MTMELEPMAEFRANVGINTAAKLVGWAILVREAFPTAKFMVYGSSLKSKTWRDIDVIIAFPDEATYRKYVPVSVGNRLGTDWDVFAAGFSALGEQMVGAQVEVHLTWLATGCWVEKETTIDLLDNSNLG